MNWLQYVKFLQKQGFTGDAESLPAVQKWLGENGFDTDELEGADGRVYELKTLFEQRPGRKMTVGDVEREAEFEARVSEQVKKETAEVIDHFGLNPKSHLNDNGRPDQTVIGNVRSRLEDDPTGGFSHFGEFAAQVAGFCVGKTYAPGSKLETYAKTFGVMDGDGNRITKDSATTWSGTEVGADGGFAVPPEYRDSITSLVMGEDSILSRCDQFPLSRNEINLPADETTPWEDGSGSTGGITAYWEGEAQTFKQTKVALESKKLRVRKVTALVPVTEELMEDSTAMGAYINRKAPEVIDFKVGEAIFRGSGTGQPLGFLNGGSTIEVPKEDNQTGPDALALTAHNVFDMWSRMYGPSRANAVWFIHQDLEPSLFGMTLQATDAAGGNPSGGGPIYLPAGTVAGSPYATLFGRSVIPTQHAAAIRTPGDIVFAAMDKYIAAVKTGGIESATSIHLWFDQDIVAFRFRMRVDGQPWRREPIPPRDPNANTLSDFITLEARPTS